MSEVIYIKFKKPIAIQIPGAGLLSPPIYAHMKYVPGQGRPIPVQEYHLEDHEADDHYRFGWKGDVHAIRLLPEVPSELPKGFANASEAVKNAYQASQASSIAGNVAHNDEVRAQLAKYVKSGVIEIVDEAKPAPTPAQKVAVKLPDPAPATKPAVSKPAPDPAPAPVAAPAAPAPAEPSATPAK